MIAQHQELAGGDHHAVDVGTATEIQIERGGADSEILAWRIAIQPQWSAIDAQVATAKIDVVTGHGDHPLDQAGAIRRESNTATSPRCGLRTASSAWEVNGRRRP